MGAMGIMGKLGKLGTARCLLETGFDPCAFKTAEADVACSTHGVSQSSTPNLHCQAV